MNRDLKLDTLKGFLIFLVILVHIPFGFFGVEIVDIVKYISQWFDFFHMPVFLM